MSASLLTVLIAAVGLATSILDYAVAQKKDSASPALNQASSLLHWLLLAIKGTSGGDK